ncbi:hypothetical protein AX768_08295 [Burkholderia sp. PAMC 28687]|nr:hypothetical protein AXG89_14420 [Burkholderia sp. PAMC 26561]AMM14101.1 hypothetical protein AX768_08295 [Burkholderia sp. PAMC 28687]
MGGRIDLKGGALAAPFTRRDRAPRVVGHAHGQTARRGDGRLNVGAGADMRMSGLGSSVIVAAASRR